MSVATEEDQQTYEFWATTAIHTHWYTYVSSQQRTLNRDPRAIVSIRRWIKVEVLELNYCRQNQRMDRGRGPQRVPVFGTQNLTQTLVSDNASRYQTSGNHIFLC